MENEMDAFLSSEADGLIMRDAGNWAEEKLYYLERYINIFEKSMRNRFNRRFYIDLFAGPGKNQVKSTKKILLGSPIIALTTKYPFSNYIFVELNKNLFNALQNRCSHSQLINQIEVKCDDCNRIIGDIINKIPDNSLNLAFIDPAGLTINWSTIESLAGIKRMDLIIYYPEYSLNLNMKRLAESSSDTAIDRFFGSREWREIYKSWQNKPRLSGVHKELIDFYKSNLCNLGYKFIKQGDEICSEPLINNTKKGHLYRLIFACKHPLGNNFWEKVIKRDLYGQERLF